MQPHAPYLARGTGQKLKQIQSGIRKQAETGGADGRLAAAGGAVRSTVEAALEGFELVQKAGLWLELDPVDLVRNGTRAAAMELYEENLRIALESVSDLVPELDGRVVVTADHGEAFGEEGVWEHHIETHIPALVEVPWLECR
jgi:hypothetical protein